MITANLNGASTVVDLIIKALIAGLITLAGFLFTEVYGDVRALKNQDQNKSGRLMVIESQQVNTERQLEIINKKLDRILEWRGK